MDRMAEVGDGIDGVALPIAQLRADGEGPVELEWRSEALAPPCL
jgi:hypothetical protein